MCLHIVIHRNKCIALCRIQSGNHCIMLPCILRKLDDAHTGIIPHQSHQSCHRLSAIR